MKGTITAYDAQRAVATVKLENGAEAIMHAVAFQDPKLPAVGDEIVGEVSSDVRLRIVAARRIKAEPEGKIEVAHCVHCKCIMLAPQTDMCDCGAELYPVTKMVPLGQSLRFDQLKGG